MFQNPFALPENTATEMAGNLDVVGDGDVYLLAGSGDAVIRLKVNSHILRIASTTFKALLDTTLREEKDLNIREPKEIPLPEDNAPSMTIHL